VKIGVLGATGPAGAGLSARLASVGHEVLVGSRDRARAERVVAELHERWGDRVAGLRGVSNAEATDAHVVVLGVNADAAVDTAAAHADALQGKVVVSMASALVKHDREFRPALPPEGSVAAAVQAAAPGARVVAAWQHVPAASFGDLDQPIEGDVIVCADDDSARAAVLELARQIPGVRALDGGSLANAVGVEAFAAVLLTINLRHRTKASLGLHGLEP
jgi:8-hydroxy-5-deazaflavin:NADPH oxidoreductase